MAPNDPVSLDPLNVFSAGAASLRGVGNTFEVMRYPSELAEANHPHYVMFYINVRKSDLTPENASQVANIYFENSAQNRPNTEGNIKTITSLVGGAFGAKAGGKVGDVVAPLTGLPPGVSEMVGKGLGAVIGAGAGLITGALMERNQVLMKDVIALYLSGKPSAHYTASWEDQELGLVGATTNSQFGFNGQTAEDMGAASAAYLMKRGEGLADNDLGNLGKTFEAGAAMTPNPFKAQLFKSMKFRTFSFDYVFLPKDIDEYTQVKKIIHTFKKYMHPVLGSGNKFIMKYPAEFNIAYYYKYDVNPELFRISNCALTDLKVEYGGTDFTTFRRTRGAPTEISMKLQFTELELLSQERFDADIEF